MKKGNRLPCRVAPKISIAEPDAKNNMILRLFVMRDNGEKEVPRLKLSANFS